MNEGETMNISELALAAMQAGLNNKALPTLGRLTKEQILIVNSVYDNARNWAAGMAVKQP